MSDGPARPGRTGSGRSDGRPPGRPGRLVLAALAALSLLLLAGLLVPGRFPSGLFALATTAFPVVLMALGARRGGNLDRRVAVVLGLLFVLLEASALGILTLAGNGGEASSRISWSLFGLPAAALVQLAGLWLLPLPLVAFAYAWTFDRTGVTREDLAALRRRASSTGRTDAPGAAGDPALHVAPADRRERP